MNETDLEPNGGVEYSQEMAMEARRVGLVSDSSLCPPVPASDASVIT